MTFKPYANTSIIEILIARYFKEYGCTVMLYVMAPDISVVDECDADVLAKTVIKGR